MRLSRISTSIALDLSSPSIALVFSRFLLSLQAHIIDLRENVKNVASMIIDETHSQSAISWRTDRRVYNESTSENRDAHDMITRWVEGQRYISAIDGEDKSSAMLVLIRERCTCGWRQD